MMGQEKTREQLVTENEELWRRVQSLEARRSETGDERRCWNPSDSRWRSFLDGTPLFILVLDRNCRVRFANHTDSGVTLNQIIGKPLYDFCRPEDRENVRACVEQVFLTGEPGVYEGPGLRLDHQEHWYASHFGPVLEDGKVGAVSVISVNVTDRMLVEKALQESEERYRLLMESVPQTVWRTDTEGNLLDCNRHWFEYSGQTFDEATNSGWTETIHPDDRQRVVQELRGLVSRGMVFQFEERLRRASDGSYRWHLARGVPAKDDKDKVTGWIGSTTDIHDQKCAEVALQKAHSELERRVEERTSELRTANEQLRIFRMFAETSGQAFAMANFDHRVSYSNPAMLRLCGEEKVEDILGKNFLDYYPGELRERLEEQMLAGVQQEGHWAGELNFVAATGESRAVLTDAFQIRNDTGDPLVFAVVMTDITELKKAQGALAESEMKYRQLVETTGTGYVILDSEGRIIDANAEYIRISGHNTLEDILGRTVVEWTAPHDMDRNAKEVEKCYQKGFVRQLEIDYVHPDGKIIPIDINATCLDTEEGRRIVCLCRDITERKQAEEALRQSHDELRAIYDGAVEGLAIFDIGSFEIVQVNAALCNMWGYGEEEFKALTPEQRYPLDALPKIRAHYEAVLEGRESRYDVQPCLRRDGTLRYMDVIANRIAYNGRPCLLLFFHDVTEREQVQATLERERRSLWRMLQASDHERQIISYEIHDGLAQYLAAAGMQFQVHDSLRHSNPEEAKKAYDAATQLVSQSHSEARRLISEVRPPIIDEIGLETAISHLVYEQRRHGGPEIECLTNVQFGRLAPILENALYRIVQEALTNACKHSGSKKVTVTMSQEGQDLRLEVQDWGIGFDSESVGKDRFGLEGIRQRVRLLGGRLTIESAPSSGTLIQVVVPILENQNDG